MLVGAAFLNIYITQPVQPLLVADFSATALEAARSVSWVLLGIALANLPFGLLADRVRLPWLIGIASVVLALAGMVCACAADIDVLNTARLVQGLSIPALTTCVAAYLARVLPRERLNVAMGRYVAATVIGGMFSRMLGGGAAALHDWRTAFVLGSGAVLVVCALALRKLPSVDPAGHTTAGEVGYGQLLRRGDLWLLMACGAAGQAMFSTIFNTLPHRLSSSPFELGAGVVGLFYLAYLSAIWAGPAAGRLSDRWGHGPTLLAGAAAMAASLGVLLVPSLTAIALGLLGACGGFFAVHAAAVGALNRKVEGGHGRANALYVLCYYLGASGGISFSALVYQRYGWVVTIVSAMAFTTVPFAVGLFESRVAGREAV